MPGEIQYFDITIQHPNYIHGDEDKPESDYIKFRLMVISACHVYPLEGKSHEE